MNFKVAFVSLVFAFAVLFIAKGSGFQRFSNGFYTRSLETAEYLDQGSGLFNPFYIPVTDWSLVPRLTLTVTHDDNINLTAEEAKSGYFIDLIPGAIFIYGRPDNNNVYLDAGTIIHLYDSEDELDRKVDYYASLGGQYKTPKTTINAGGEYRYKDEIDTVVGGRVIQENYVLDAAVEQELSAKTALGLDLTHEISDYDAENLVDSTRDYAAVNGYYKNTESRDTFLRLGVGHDDADAVGSIGDTDFYDISIGMRGKQSPKLVLAGSVGYQYRDFLDDESDDFEHWIASASIESNPFGFTTVYGLVDTSIRPAVSSVGQTTVDQRYTLGLRRQLFTRRLQGAISGFYGIVDYYGTFADDPAFNLDREDEYWGYNIGVDYWTAKSVSIGLDYSFFRNLGNRQGTQELKDQATYDQGRWVLRVSWNF